MRRVYFMKPCDSPFDSEDRGELGPLPFDWALIRGMVLDEDGASRGINADFVVVYDCQLVWAPGNICIPMQMQVKKENLSGEPPHQVLPSLGGLYEKLGFQTKVKTKTKGKTVVSLTWSNNKDKGDLAYVISVTVEVSARSCKVLRLRLPG